MAKQVSSRGRYGDTTMIHVSPEQVAYLDRHYPGMVTTNPDTGQPEAFWFVLPMLSTIMGGLSAAGTALGAGALGTGALAQGIGTVAGIVPSILGQVGGLATSALSNILPGFLGGAGGATGIGGSAVPWVHRCHRCTRRRFWRTASKWSVGIHYSNPERGWFGWDPWDYVGTGSGWWNGTCGCGVFAWGQYDSDRIWCPQHDSDRIW